MGNLLFLVAAGVAPMMAMETAPPVAGGPAPVATTTGSAHPDRGRYFHGQSDRTSPLPTFEQVRDRLPEPVIDGHPDWLPMYWKCWQLAFAHLKRPGKESPLVASWLDEAFSPKIFQWDTCFMMMFARYGHAQFPFIQSLDNFYAFQLDNGYIGREYVERTGIEVQFGGWKNAVNPPLFAWAECESFHVTGDRSRFAAVLPVLEKYVECLNRDGDPEAPPERWREQGRRSLGTPHLLYWNTPLGCGMDDTPRSVRKGAGWVDMSCQMVMQYRDLARMSRELGLPEKAAAFQQEGDRIGARINTWCWDEGDGFYYDVLADGTKFRKKTAGGFWPMIAGIASPAQVGRLVEHLRNEREFWRPFVFPALAADEKEYQNPTGAYWRGAVWAPVNYMIIKGLEANDQAAFAAEASEKYLAGMAEVFQRRGTVFENYMPEKFEASSGKGDFVGWTGVGPITLLIENVLGFQPDGAHRRLAWRLARQDRHGIRRLRFGTVEADLLYDGHGMVTVATNQPFTLVINGHVQEIAGPTATLAVTPLPATSVPSARPTTP